MGKQEQRLSILLPPSQGSGSQQLDILAVLHYSGLPARLELAPVTQTIPPTAKVVRGVSGLPSLLPSTSDVLLTWQAVRLL